MKIAYLLGDDNLPKIESYDMLIKKFLTAKNLVKQTRIVDDANDLNSKKKKFEEQKILG